jgi:transcription antitermination protein NusB
VPNPTIRRRGRERALQFLFGLDFTEYGWRESMDAFWTACASRPGVRQYAEGLIEGVMERVQELDAAIAGAADNWAPERIGRIERNILRVALYEMRYSDDVPPAVAINEAVEVAKRYGSDEAPRFVNGVLDRLRKG